MAFKRIQCRHCENLFTEEQIILSHEIGWDVYMVASCESCFKKRNPHIIIKENKS